MNESRRSRAATDFRVEVEVRWSRLRWIGERQSRFTAASKGTRRWPHAKSSTSEHTKQGRPGEKQPKPQRQRPLHQRLQRPGPEQCGRMANTSHALATTCQSAPPTLRQMNESIAPNSAASHAEQYASTTTLIACPLSFTHSLPRYSAGPPISVQYTSSPRPHTASRTIGKFIGDGRLDYIAAAKSPSSHLQLPHKDTRRRDPFLAAPGYLNHAQHRSLQGADMSMLGHVVGNLPVR
jgi:hypothetical protein